MAPGFSAVNLVNKWLDVLRGTTFTGLSGLYVGMHTGDPGAAGTANVAAGDGTRKQITLNPAADGSITLASAESVWTNGGIDETITHITLWDAPTAGNFVDSIAVITPRPWSATNQMSFNSLSIAITPIAA